VSGDCIVEDRERIETTLDSRVGGPNPIAREPLDVNLAKMNDRRARSRHREYLGDRNEATAVGEPARPLDPASRAGFLSCAPASRLETNPLGGSSADGLGVARADQAGRLTVNVSR
jgi:hypothetical protein